LSQALADETNQPLQMIHLKRAVLVTTEFSSNWDNQDPIKVEIQKEIDEELEKIQKKKLEDKKNEELKKEEELKNKELKSNKEEKSNGSKDKESKKKKKKSKAKLDDEDADE